MSVVVDSGRQLLRASKVLDLGGASKTTTLLLHS